MKIKLGDTVTWFSGANGTYMEKQGEVVQVVMPGRRPDSKRFTAFSRWAGSPRKHESYVVAVKRPKSVKLYWPRVSGLRVIGGENV